MGRYEKYAVAGLFLAFAATLAPWAADFPLNDDWAYALAVRAFSETGRLVLSDWGSSTQITHILAGTLVTKVFGFSFAALRIMNICIAAAALFMFVKLMDELGAGRFEKMAAGLTLAFSPIYLVLASSFMTDVHYLFWMLSAMYFFARNLNDPEDRPALVWAGACTAAAYLTRQLAVALPLAFTVALLLRGRFRWRDLAPAWGLPLAAMALHQLWFTFMHGPTWASVNYVSGATLSHLASPGRLAGDSAFRLFSAAMETGLLLLPLAAGFIFSARHFFTKNDLHRRVTCAAPIIVLAALAVFALVKGPLPYLENNLTRSGLGVLTLGGAALKPSGFFASGLFWGLCTAAAAISAVLLMCASGLSLRAGSPALRFVFAASLLQLAVSMIGAKFFDRYLLTLLPGFAAAAAFAGRGVRFSRAAALLALLLCAGAGWAGMKDYLAWNKAKWELATKPRQGISPDEIANGFDYQAWFSYERNMAYLKSMKPLSMIGEWEWQGMNQYKALVAFNPDPRFRIADKQEYCTPLSARKGVLYLLTYK